MANPHYSLLNNASHVQISGGTFQMGPSVDEAARDLLAKNISPNSLPDSDAMYDGPKCYPETRKAIHRKLARWIRRQDDIDTKFIWLQGGAGAGKSAIMRTIAMGGPTKQDDYSETPHVLGSFFFSRQDSTRSTARPLIPTLAFQLCKAHHMARDLILQTITDNRELIFTESLRNQVLSLLVRPLSRLEKEYKWLSRADDVQDENQPGRVFIIDGLDECELNKQAEIIETLAILVKQLPICILLASRPEKQISTAIHHNSTLRGICSEISLSDDPDSDDDIRIFLEESLKEIRERYNSDPEAHSLLPDLWPADEDVNKLVDKSSKHFIYASTAEKYIASGVERPDVALRVIMGLQPVRTGQPFEELDALYRHILGKAQFQKEVLEIISFPLIVPGGYDRIEDISYFLGYSPDDIHHFLSDMRALIVIRGPSREEKRRVGWHHKSFEDFLQDETRAREFYIGTQRQFHRDHLERYFTLLDKYLATPTDAERQCEGYSDLPSDRLVEQIGTGIAASPLSDTTTALIKQHPPHLIFEFLSSVHITRSPPYQCRYYMWCIGQYDFEGLYVYKDSVKSFLDYLQEKAPPIVADDMLDDIMVPLLLAGLDRPTLEKIFNATTLFKHTKEFCEAFTAFYYPDPISDELRCQHWYPSHILRQIRGEMADADNDLAGPVLKMLALVVKEPGRFEEAKLRCHWSPRTFQKCISGILKALTLVLPKVPYRDDIALYARCQLPALADFQDSFSWQSDISKCIDQETERYIKRARRAMDAYLQRGGHPAVDANIGQPDSGDCMDADDSDAELEEGPYRYNPDCRHCNKNLIIE